MTWEITIMLILFGALCFALAHALASKTPSTEDPTVAEWPADKEPEDDRNGEDR